MNHVPKLSPALRLRLWAFTAVLALLIMESTGISLWYQAIFRPERTSWGMVFLLLFAISGVSHLLVRGLAPLKWRLLARQAVLFGWIVLAAFLSLKLLIYPLARMSLLDLVNLPVGYIFRSNVSGTGFYHLVVIGLLIWRSVALARSPATLTGAQFSFQLGLVLLLLYGMMFAPFFPVEATLGLYVFLFCGLVAMSAARIASLNELRGGRIPRFGPGWLTSLVLASLAVVGLAILAGWLASGRVVDVLATVVLGILALLTALVLLLLSPLLVLLARLMPYIAEFLQQLLARLRLLPISGQLTKLFEELNQGLVKVIPYVLASRMLILTGILLGIVLVILLALRMRKIHRQKMIEEEEAGPAQPGVTGSLLDRLKRLWQDARSLRLRSPAQLLAAARIRQIYRHLMALCQKMGDPRPLSVTPLEFLPRLVSLFPEEAAGLQRITGAYLNVRYGLYPETRQEVEAVEQAWKQVRRRGRKILSTRVKKKSVV